MPTRDQSPVVPAAIQTPGPDRDDGPLSTCQVVTEHRALDAATGFQQQHLDGRPGVVMPELDAVETVQSGEVLRLHQEVDR